MKKKITRYDANNFMSLADKKLLEQAKIKTKEEIKKTLEDLDTKDKTFLFEKRNSEISGYVKYSRY